MDDIRVKYDEEIRRLQKKQSECEVGTEEYAEVQGQLLAAINARNEMVKTDDARKGARVDTAIRIATLIGGVVITPIVTLKCKERLTNVIGKIEQIDTFVSTPGRSISSWFNWK